MMKRREFVKSGCIATAATLQASSLSAEPNSGGAQKRPNILFIMTDQQFAEAMSCRMGKEYLNTPAMDSLAESGMLFSRAYSPNPLCMPARNSIFTGRYPHETGITANSGPQLDPKEFVNLGNYFREAGYETAYFGKWHLRYDSKDGEAHGFETAECLHGNGHDGEVGDLSAGYLAKKKGAQTKPFLLVVSLSNPHDICQFSRNQKLPSGPIGDTPPPDACPPPPPNIAPPINESDSMATLRVGYHGEGSKFPVGDFTEDKWRQYHWGYHRLVEMVDGEIAKVLDSLRASGLEDNTAIVFTSDHGECAGAHGFNQKTVFYEESSRIPLIVSYKGKTPKNTCDKFINTGVDLLPTMLDFAGIPVPKNLTGRSLRPIALGQAGAEWRDHVVIQNHLVQTVTIGDLRAQAQGRMVRSERFKYCVYEFGVQRESLVDMQSDPLETRNLATDPKHRKTLLEHRQLLKAFAAKHNDAIVGEMLADDVGPRPFMPDPPRKRPKKV